MRAVISTFAILTIAAPGPSAEAVAPRLQDAINRARAESNLPATATLVVSRKATLFRQVAGIANARTGTAIAANPYWHIGSAIKPFIASMAVIEQQRGRVKLDAPLEQLVPAWNPIIDSGYRAVTLRILLQHRAGVPPFMELTDAEVDPLRHFRGNPIEQREAFARYVLSSAPIETAPTAKPHYSNAGYSIAAHVLERRASQDWQSLLRADVLRPAGATGCFSGWPPPARNQPVGHHLVNGRPEPVAPFPVPAVLAPAGHLTCRTDALAALARWKLAQLESCPKDAEQCDWALGLGQNETARGTRVYTILGSLDQFVLLMAFYPDDDRAS